MNCRRIRISNSAGHAAEATIGGLTPAARQGRIRESADGAASVPEVCECYDGVERASVLEINMATAIEEVRQILDKLPPEASLEDIQYHIYVRQKIERGLDDVREGRVISQEEAEKKMSKWLGE